MQATDIPREILVQAAMLNRFGGTLQAWAFLASKGLREEQIFTLLINVEGPQCPLTAIVSATPEHLGLDACESGDC